MLKLVLIIVGCVAVGLWLLDAVVGLLLHTLPASPAARRRQDGLVLFVEPLRWLGRHGHERPFRRGLAAAGYTGLVEYWQWQSAWRANLVVPALADRKFTEKQARRLAERICRERAEHPELPLCVCGVSAGAPIAVRALELLPDGVVVDGAVLLCGAISPWHDLSA